MRSEDRQERLTGDGLRVLLPPPQPARPSLGCACTLRYGVRETGQLACAFGACRDEAYRKMPGEAAKKAQPATEVCGKAEREAREVVALSRVLEICD